MVDQLDADHGDPVAWALPLHRTEDGTSWATTDRNTRRGRLVLVDGTSPAGLRLPLSSVSWTPPPGTPEVSRFRELAPLPAPAALDADGLALVDPPPAVVTPVDKAPTTALCVRERDGHLYVFLPPVEEGRTPSRCSAWWSAPRRGSGHRWCWRATRRPATRAPAR